MWVCPRCGARFVGRNMWHSCGPWTVEGFLEGKGPRARELLRRVREAHAQVWALRLRADENGRWIHGEGAVRGGSASLRTGDDVWILAEAADPQPALTKVEHIPKENWVYTLRIPSPEELDEEVLVWLREAYDVGLQRHLG